MNKTPYEILKVSEKASFDQIRKAYLMQVRLSPPEKDPEGFKKIRKAYELLKDYESRKKLDFSLFHKDFNLKSEQKQEDIDFKLLFKDRIFMLILAASDFYIQDFTENFEDMDEKVKQLR